MALQLNQCTNTFGGFLVFFGNGGFLVAVSIAKAVLNVAPSLALFQSYTNPTALILSSDIRNSCWITWRDFSALHQLATSLPPSLGEIAHEWPTLNVGICSLNLTFCYRSEHHTTAMERQSFAIPIGVYGWAHQIRLWSHNEGPIEMAITSLNWLLTLTFIYYLQKTSQLRNLLPVANRLRDSC